jgi:hypothetical protein
MRTLVLTFVRLGPTLVYAAGMLFAASIILLATFPGNPLSWALYLTLLPVLRLPAFVLLDLPGVEVWHAIAALASIAAGLKLTPQLRINAAEMATTTAAMVAAFGSRKRRPLSRRLCRWL